MCKALKVPRSSYYRRLKNPGCIFCGQRAQLESPTDEGFAGIRNSSFGITVAWHMREMGLRSKLSRRFKVTTDASHDYKVARNLLNREFNKNEPVKACVSDLTYIPCRDGFLYLTCVLDLFDRKLIGWPISDHMNASHTVISAIRMANRNRPFIEGMIFHSDRGSSMPANKL